MSDKKIKLELAIKRDNFQLAVDLSIPAEGITAIFGPSGSGKTSLLRAIAGLDKYPNAFIQFHDHIWQNSRECLPTYKRKLGYVFQDANLFEHLNVQKNIEYGFKRNSETDNDIVENLVSLLNLQSFLERKPLTLSGGERQRVALARALAAQPDVLLMDEPLASLDEASKAELLSLIILVQEKLKVPIIYVSHSTTEIARLANYLILLNKSGIQAVGNIDSMLTRLDLPLAYYDDAAAVIETSCVEFDQHYKIAYLEFSGGRFSVPSEQIITGTQLRVRIAARDVSIALKQQTQTSILNSFSALIEEVSEVNCSQVLMRLNVKGVIFLSRITRKSFDQLELHLGDMVYLKIKSIAVLSQ